MPKLSNKDLDEILIEQENIIEYLNNNKLDIIEYILKTKFDFISNENLSAIHKYHEILDLIVKYTKSSAKNLYTIL